MNDIANSIQDGIANLSSMIDMLIAVSGSFTDVADAMRTVLRIVGMLTGA
jgi:hypothetical protein